MAGRKTTQEINQLTEYVFSKVSSKMLVDEVILFGSYAKGEETDLSDVDIAIVCPELDSANALFRNTLNVIRATGLCEPYLQLLAFPSEIYYNEELYCDPDFIREIKRTGKVFFKKTVD